MPPFNLSFQTVQLLVVFSTSRCHGLHKSLQQNELKPYFFHKILYQVKKKNWLAIISLLTFLACGQNVLEVGTRGICHETRGQKVKCLEKNNVTAYYIGVHRKGKVNKDSITVKSRLMTRSTNYTRLLSRCSGKMCAIVEKFSDCPKFLSHRVMLLKFVLYSCCV